MNLKEKWREYSDDPFGFCDSVNLTFKGYRLNLFQKVDWLRTMALFTAAMSLGAWVVFGFDSTPLQFIHVLYEGVPAWIVGQLSLADLGAIYVSYYGKEMHYSAFVIYGLMFYGLSKHFSRHGILRSQNIAYSCGLTFLAIATFEYYWIYSFAFWQGQAWVSTWAWPQLRILMQNLAFLFCGVLTVVYMGLDSFLLKDKKIVGRRFRFRVDWLAFLMIGLTVGGALLWYYYPWPVDHINVEIAGGAVWTNSRHFPQTLYTVDVDPTDGINAGVWFWVENNAVHGLNTLVKIIWSVAIMYIGLIKKGGYYDDKR